MSGRPPYAQVARTPRMLGLLLLFLVIAAVCGRLGAWQIDRARQHAATAPEAVAAVPLADLLAPQEPFRGDLVGRTVVVEGEFGLDVLTVPERRLDGRTGSWALAPFTVADTGAVLAVVRGWLPEEAVAPAVPDGVVQLQGRLEAGEAATSGDITSVSPAQLVNRWGGPIYSGFLVQDDPPAGLTVVPPPEPESGWDLRNLAYALQWWIFGGAAVLLWARMVRDEAQDLVAADAREDEDAREDVDAREDEDGSDVTPARDAAAAP